MVARCSLLADKWHRVTLCGTLCIKILLCFEFIFSECIMCWVEYTHCAMGSVCLSSRWMTQPQIDTILQFSLHFSDFARNAFKLCFNSYLKLHYSTSVERCIRCDSRQLRSFIIYEIINFPFCRQTRIRVTGRPCVEWVRHVKHFRLSFFNSKKKEKLHEAYHRLNTLVNSWSRNKIDFFPSSSLPPSHSPHLWPNGQTSFALYGSFSTPSVYLAENEPFVLCEFGRRNHKYIIFHLDAWHHNRWKKRLFFGRHRL